MVSKWYGTRLQELVLRTMDTRRIVTYGVTVLVDMDHTSE